MTARLMIVLLLAARIGTGEAQEERNFESPTLEDIQKIIDEFNLSTNCEPMRLSVLIENTEDELSLEQVAVHNAVESRLRSARIYTESFPSPILEIYVHIVGVAFHVRLSLQKTVFDSLTGHLGIATTW